MRFCNAEVGEQQGSGFGLHRAAAVGMQGELRQGATLCFFDDGVVEQGFEQRSAFSIGDAPGDDPAAENIDDDIEIEIAPFRGPHQLRYVPRTKPDLGLRPEVQASDRRDAGSCRRRSRTSSCSARTRYMVRIEHR